MSQPAAPATAPSEVQQPPIHVGGILLRLGPGLIIAGSIVGSGELIATTKTGAEAGFWLLWLIVVGCIIKVFVQVELGRDAVVRGKTTMDALSEVPGPRIAGRGNWLIWYYFLMFAASIGQLGGIVGGVGQALAISMPLTEQGRTYNAYVEAETQLAVARAEAATAQQRAGMPGAGPADSLLAAAQAERVAELENRLDALGPKPLHGTQLRLGERFTYVLSDDRIWAAIVAAGTAVLLVVGHYGLIQTFATAMVAAFTFVTIANVIALQWTPWAVTWPDLAEGLWPDLGRLRSGAGISTALMTFGIIGVGATELVAYPYWCLEKGYARFTGPREESQNWVARARGWMNVMRWDAWCSMVVYTIATVAFYLLGAAILFRSNLNPSGNELIRTLAVMYEPVFGAWAQWLFLIGAFAVLYSTFFVANAGHARVVSDGLRVVGLGPHDSQSNRRRVRALSGILPLVCLVVYLVLPTTPDRLVLISGMMQAFMLPMLSAAALYFRYQKCDPRLAPGKAWDAFLWLSSLGMLICGLWLAYMEIMKVLK